jgi:hypothetical protein
MRKHQGFKIRFSSCAAVMLLAASLGTPARADFQTDLSVTVVPQAGGVFEYDYVLTDKATSTVGASQLFFAVSPLANLLSSAPAGWDTFYNPGDTSISFLSSDPSFDVAPGSSAIFTLISPEGPALNADVVRGLDDVSGSFFNNPGMINTPSVPEPSALVLVGMGAAVALALRVRRRRQVS